MHGCAARPRSLTKESQRPSGAAGRRHRVNTWSAQSSRVRTRPRALLPRCRQEVHRPAALQQQGIAREDCRHTRSARCSMRRVNLSAKARRPLRLRGHEIDLVRYPLTEISSNHLTITLCRNHTNLSAFLIIPGHTLDRFPPSH